MRIKKYLVKTFDEALSQIKRELGDDAYIMSTRKVEKKGKLNLSREEWVEVTAAIEREDNPLGSATISPMLLSRAYGAKNASIATSAEQESPIKMDRLHPSDPLQPLREEIGELKRLIQTQGRKEVKRPEMSGFTGVHDDWYQQLLRQGVDANLAIRLIDNLRVTWPDTKGEPGAVGKRMVDVLSAFIGKASPIVLREKASLVALIGPTGVGKTTTVAKLAAYFKLLEGKKVAMVSLDGFRIGGIAQLRTFGDLMDVPVFVVRDEGDLIAVLKKVQSYDLVLFDTPGYGPRDQQAIEKLTKNMRALTSAGGEIHLLLDATRKEEDLFGVYKTYQKLRPNKLILSKVDESSSIGNLLNLKIQSALPISYLTVGQRVPEDIEVAHPRRVANRLLGGINQAGGER